MTTPGYPVRVEASLDPDLSRWLWLVKWVLAIPHYVILFFLWVAFVVLSVCALVAIVFTGRYPRGIFDFNVGVLRWSWRVAYYAYGGLGTDHYPPFSLSDDPDFPAHLEVSYPEHLSRGLVLVKWWLLAIPHYLVLAVFLGGGWYLTTDPREAGGQPWLSGGLIGLLVLVAAVVLLFTGRYPQPVFDFVLGMNRWVLRVAAYVALMTDEYPPFRLDMGGPEPGQTRLAVPAGAPAGPPPGPSPAGPEPGRWSAGRVVAVIAGATVFLVAGALLTAGAALGFADSFMRDGGYLMSQSTTVVSRGSAVLSPGIELHDGTSSALPAQLLGRVRVDVTPGTGRSVFVGIARSQDVTAYLAGVARSTVLDPSADGGRPTYRQDPGGRPAVPPSAAGIWSASSAGSGPQTLTWPVREGSWTLVVMNSDGSPGVNAVVALGATVPAATGVVVALLVTGGLLLVVSVLVLVGAVRRPRKSAPAVAASP